MQINCAKTNQSVLTNQEQSKKNIKGHKGTPTKGGGFMMLLHSVWNHRQELYNELNHLEMRVFDFVLTKTIKWNTKVADIHIEDFTEAMNKRPQHIYAALKTLLIKGILIKIRSKGKTYYGLNEAYFGQILAGKHERAYREKQKAKIRLVPDDTNKASNEPGSPKRGELESVQTDPVGQTNESRYINPDQPFVTKENFALVKKSLKESFKESLKESQNQGRISFSSGEGNGMQSIPKPQNEAFFESEKVRQLAEFRKVYGNA